MSILDKLKPSSESKERARERAADLRTKGGQDLRAAERVALAKAEKVRAEARRQLSQAGQGVQEPELQRREGRTLGNVDSPDTNREILARAGRAASLRSPVNATLDPSPSGPGIERFTVMGDSSEGSSGGSESDYRDESGAGFGAGFITGERRQETDDGILAFDDDGDDDGGSLL